MHARVRVCVFKRPARCFQSAGDLRKRTPRILFGNKTQGSHSRTLDAAKSVALTLASEYQYMPAGGSYSVWVWVWRGLAVMPVLSDFALE